MAKTVDQTNNPVLAKVKELLTQYGWSPEAQAGILASMSRESAFNPDATNNNGERSYGLFQWNGPRQDAMRRYAADHGLPANSVEAQVGYFNHEMNTTEKAAGDMIRNAPDVATANLGMRHFERYGGGSEEQNARLAAAQRFYTGDYSGVRPSRAEVTGTPTDPTIDPMAVQRALNAAGVTDSYGSKLVEDGIIGPRSQSARDRILDKARSLTPSSSPEQVTAVQAALNSLGVRGQDGNALAVDGKFGPQTAFAVTQIVPAFRPISPRAEDGGDPNSRGGLHWVAGDKNSLVDSLKGFGNRIENGIKDIFGVDHAAKPVDGLPYPPAPTPATAPTPTSATPNLPATVPLPPPKLADIVSGRVKDDRYIPDPRTKDDAYYRDPRTKDDLYIPPAPVNTGLIPAPGSSQELIVNKLMNDDDAAVKAMNSPRASDYGSGFNTRKNVTDDQARYNLAKSQTQNPIRSLLSALFGG